MHGKTDRQTDRQKERGNQTDFRGKMRREQQSFHGTYVICFNSLPSHLLSYHLLEKLKLSLRTTNNNWEENEKSLNESFQAAGKVIAHAYNSRLPEVDGQKGTVQTNECETEYCGNIILESPNSFGIMV